MTDEQIIAELLHREGGYVNDPSDKGGATKFGVTQRTLGEYRGHEVSSVDVEMMDESEARAIYRQMFIIDPGFHKIGDSRLRGLLVDMAANHGPKNAVKMLQRACGVSDDGVLGEQTMMALSRLTVTQALAKLCAERVRFYGRIITHDTSQAKFAAGWLNRAAEFIEDIG